jgi:hypothetical protein
MDTRIEATDCDEIDLDHIARYYHAFLRSLWLIRAILGCVTWLVIVIPLLFVVAAYLLVTVPSTNAWGEPSSSWRFIVSWQYAVGITIYSLLIVSIWYTLFYLLRTISAGSIGAARFMVAFISPVLLLNAICLCLWVLVLGYLVIFGTHTDANNVPPPRDSVFSKIAPAIYWNLLGVYTAYVLISGLVGQIKSRNQPFHRLFQNQKYRREFWPGRAALLYNFWLVMGIWTRPRKLRRSTRVTRVAIAAVCAFMLEGFIVTAYMWPTTPFMLLGREPKPYQEYVQYADEVSWPLEFAIGVLFMIPLIMGWCWGIFALSRTLRRYARRHSLDSAADAMLADPRKPVVFLRSFSDDQISLSKAEMPLLLRFLYPGALVGTLEELLVSEYADIGPVIAIGKPSDDPDDLPPLGAARQYCHGTEWQEIVCSLMEASALIVVGVGRSAGLAWEIATIRSANLLTKTVFVFSPDLTKDRSMLHDLLTMLGLNGETPPLRSDQAVLSVSFRAPEGPLLLFSSRITEVAYRICLRAAEQPDLILSARNHDIEAHLPSMVPSFEKGASAG